jgi:hypothetical protein
MPGLPNKEESMRTAMFLTVILMSLAFGLSAQAQAAQAKCEAKCTAAKDKSMAKAEAAHTKCMAKVDEWKAGVDAKNDEATKAKTDQLFEKKKTQCETAKTKASAASDKRHAGCEHAAQRQQRKATPRRQADHESERR